MIITKTYPLKSLTVEEATELQFYIVDCITRNMSGREMLSRGDLGVVSGKNKPIITEKAERVIAEVFDTEACMLVRGAGSGSIRMGLHAILHPGDSILVHKAPIYNTTKTSLDMMGIRIVEADYHNQDEIINVIKENPQIKAALVQYTRQSPQDHYDMEEVIKAIKSEHELTVLTDDNYAALKVSKIGVQCGADLSCFSSFITFIISS